MSGYGYVSYYPSLWSGPWWPLPAEGFGGDDGDEMGRAGRGRQRLRGGGANQGGAFQPPAPRRVTLCNIAAGCELSLEEGDITAFQGPEAVIVNAANSTLLGGGGVDYAIHKAAGRDLYDACRRIAVIGGTWADRCRVGEAAWTIPGRLRVKGVVHTVGPMYSHQSHDESAELLTKAYRTSLALASEHGASTIAFPAISCGAYGYPHESAADEAVAAIAGACAGFKSVHIILYDGRYFGVWEAAMRRLQPRASSAPAMVVAAAPPIDLGSGADTLRAAAADRRRKRRPPGRYLTN